MTKEEKEALFGFLETSRRYVLASEAEARPCPEFSDDLDHAAIRDGVLACDRCHVAQVSVGAVPGTGSEQPIVLIVGDMPESTAKEPISGNAGELLDRMLSAINLSRTTNAYLTNVIKCRPVFDRAIADRAPERNDSENDEVNRCLPWLEAELTVLQPLAILVLGETAFRFLSGQVERMDRAHGTFLTRSGIPLMPTYHPRDILSDGELKRPAWEDLKALRTFLAERSPAYAAEIARLSSQGR